MIKNKVADFKKINGKNPILGCLGLTFKPNVDDIRESPAKKIIDNLISSDLKLNICEPNLKTLKGINLDSLDYVIDKSDLIIILVSHNEFKRINLQNKLFLDFCGALN